MRSSDTHQLELRKLRQETGTFVRGWSTNHDRSRSGLHQRLQFDLLVYGFNDVLDLGTAFLFLQVLRFLANEFVEACMRQTRNVFAGELFRVDKSLKQLLHLFCFAFGLRASDAERGPFSDNGRCARLRVRKTLRFNGFRCGAKVALHGGLLFSFHPLAENILVLRVGLREVVVTKSLAVLHIPGAFTIFFYGQFNAPFDFVGRTLASSAKELIVFDLQLAYVPFELAELFVDGRHAGNLAISMVGGAFETVNRSADLRDRR